MHNNQKLLKSSRRYAKDIPKCLHQRPHDFVVHIMRRLGSARELLQVPDHYNNQVGSSPTCDCEDFHRHSYPCKHIINHWLDSEGHLNIPETDQDPWISVDLLDTGALDTEDMQVKDYVIDEVNSHPAKEQAPQPSEDLSSQLQKVRQVLDELKSWTYLTTSSDVAS